MRSFTKHIDINIANWGCKSDNTTALHLTDIMRHNETNYVINKINKILSSNYQKMCGLIGLGKYQKYYMLLVRKDVLSLLDEIELATPKTLTHCKSLILMTHRTVNELEYEENNQFPKI